LVDVEIRRMERLPHVVDLRKVKLVAKGKEISLAAGLRVLWPQTRITTVEAGGTISVNVVGPLRPKAQPKAPRGPAHLDHIISPANLQGSPALYVTTECKGVTVESPSQGGRVTLSIAADKAQLVVQKLPLWLGFLFVVPRDTGDLTLEGLTAQPLEVKPKDPSKDAGQ
jgi:hypothetical protein